MGALTRDAAAPADAALIRAINEYLVQRITLREFAVQFDDALFAAHPGDFGSGTTRRLFAAVSNRIVFVDEHCATPGGVLIAEREFRAWLSRTLQVHRQLR